MREACGTFWRYPDGREICFKNAAGQAEFRRRRAYMHDRDGGLCMLCGCWVHLDDCTFGHKVSRGGGKRDDRVGSNGIAHWLGNQIQGSMSFERYMLLPLEKRRKNCGVA